jgi:hypothetical protein
MKNVLLPLALLCCTISTAFAQDYGRNRDGRDRRMDPISELRLCEARSRNLRFDFDLQNARLQECERNLERNRGDRGERERMDQLARENSELLSRNQLLIDQVEKLKIDNARLEMEAHPDRYGRFDLSASITACGKINNSIFAQQCSALARENSIQASIIQQCARIQNTYFALECVKAVGLKHTSGRQVQACLEINNVVQAQECIQVAGEKNISPELINSCVKLTTNTTLELECVKGM